MKSESKVDRFYSALSDATFFTHSLSDLAIAFLRVGNEHAAKEIFEAVKCLRNDLDEMEGVFKDELTRSVRQAEESSMNVLRTALALNPPIDPYKEKETHD